MLQILKFLLPGSFAFLIVGSVTGIALLYGPPRVRVWGRRWLAMLLALYCVLSIPVAVDALAWPLRRLPATATPNATVAEAVIVLLTGRCESTGVGGERVDVPSQVTRLRIMTAVQRYRRSAGTVLVSGASETVTPETEVIKNELIKSGVPVGRIVLDSQSRNTRQSAVNVARLLNGRRGFLVTLALHMRRSLASFAKVGANVAPVPAPDGFDETDRRLMRRLSPSRRAFEIGESAIYEYYGLAYYWSLGWI